jgi:hypothetical protein
MEEMWTHLYDFFWVVSGRLHAVVPWYPQFRWPADRFGAGNMLIITVLLSTWPFVERRDRWALVIAAAAGVIEVLNGINHIAAVFVFRQYVSGAATAPLLLVLGPMLLWELRRPRRVS